MQCHEHQDVAFLESDGVGSRDKSGFEAQSLGPLIPGVRFTVWITPERATLGTGRWPLTRADWLPRGSLKSFRIFTFLIPSYQACLAHLTSDFCHAWFA